MPEVSVIVPAYNASGLVPNAVKSIRQQTLLDLEVLLVDDGSTDATASVMDLLAKEDLRIRTVKMPENSGVYQARATGLELARGKWVGFVDSDDLVKPDMFEIMAREGADSGADIVICGVDMCDQDGKFLRHRVEFPSTHTVTEGILGRFCGFGFQTGSLWNKLYRRELITKYHGKPLRWRQDTNEDVIVNIGCFADALRVRVVKDSLYNNLIRTESVTRSLDNSRAFVSLIRAYALAVDLYHHRGEDVLGNIDRLYLHQLAFSCYRVRSLAELEPHADRFREALTILARLRPATLSAFANRGLWEPVCRQNTFESKWREWLSASKQLIKSLVPRVPRDATRE